MAFTTELEVLSFIDTKQKKWKSGTSLKKTTTIERGQYFHE